MRGQRCFDIKDKTDTVESTTTGSPNYFLETHAVVVDLHIKLKATLRLCV